MSELHAPNDQGEEKLVGYAQVAQALGISPDTVYQLMHRGKIPYFKFGKAVRFRLSDVKARIETSCRVNAAPLKRH